MSTNTLEIGGLEEKVTGGKLHPIARALLIGVYDDTNSLSCFRENQRYLLRHIFEYAINPKDWLQYIIEPEHTPEYALPNYINERNRCDQYFMKVSVPYNSYRGRMIDPKFPPQPTRLMSNIKINMMPFIMNKEFNQTKLPQSKRMKHYFKYFILPCILNDSSQINKIGFLTIDESIVNKNKTQRRPGIHTETIGGCKQGIKLIIGKGNLGNGDCQEWISWGDGESNYKNGIYIATNLDNTSVAWNCKIIPDINGRDVIGNLGNIDHLKECLPNNRKVYLQKNCLYWMTDRTPHEAIPMESNGYRQFFRLVTHPVTFWYEKHSTKNPNGVVPDPKITTVISDNKFEKPGAKTKRL